MTAPTDSQEETMTTTKTSAPTYPCGVCGRRGKAEDMIYSPHTGTRYCPTLDDCRKRAARNKRVSS